MAYFLDPELAQLVRDEQRGAPVTRTTSRSESAPAVGGRRNRYPAPCIKCGKKVPAGEGSLAKLNGAWVTEHLPSCP